MQSHPPMFTIHPSPRGKTMAAFFVNPPARMGCEIAIQQSRMIFSQSRKRRQVKNHNCLVSARSFQRLSDRCLKSINGVSRFYANAGWYVMGFRENHAVWQLQIVREAIFRFDNAAEEANSDGKKQRRSQQKQKTERAKAPARALLEKADDSKAEKPEQSSQINESKCVANPSERPACGVGVECNA